MPPDPWRVDEGLSAEMFGHIFDASPIAKVLVSPDGVIRLANLQAERLFGWSRSELVGMSIERLVPERLRSHHPAQRGGYFAKPIARAMGEGRDLYGVRKDGSEVPIEIGLSPVHTREGTFALAGVIDISSRRRAEAVLRESIAEKETLLREIHHRVKNNMQVVSSLLSLQQQRIDDPVLRGMFEECQTRVRTMALVHEKLYSTGNLAALDGGDFVGDLAQMLYRTYRPSDVDLRFELDVEQVPLDIQTAIPLGLILHELVTNALKHAFAGRSRGELRIGLAVVDAAAARLVVTDDGCGLGAEFEPSLSHGLGFRMIHTLVRQLDGELAIERGAGTTFVVSFARPGANAAAPR